MLQAVLNKSLKQHLVKQQLYGYLPLILPSKENKQDLWTPTHGHASVDQPAYIYMYHLCADTGCSLEDLPGAMDGEGESQGTPYCQHDLMKDYY